MLRRTNAGASWGSRFRLTEFVTTLCVNPSSKRLPQVSESCKIIIGGKEKGGLQFAEHVISRIGSFDRERETGKHESTDPSRHVSAQFSPRGGGFFLPPFTQGTWCGSFFRPPRIVEDAEPFLKTIRETCLAEGDR
jgi:hypothetical protein